MTDEFEELSKDQNTLTIGHKKYRFVVPELKVNLCARCAFRGMFGQCGHSLAFCMPLNRKDGRDGYWVDDSEETQ